MARRVVEVNDRMQQGYRYELTVPAGRQLDPEFRPELTPAEMLRLGIFGGKYMTDCKDEFPRSWFVGAKLSPHRLGSIAELASVSPPASRSRSGGRRGGYIQRIRAAGFNGTAATTRGDVCRTRMPAKSSDGRPCSGTCVNFSATASQAMSAAASASARPYSTGLMTVASSRRNGKLLGEPRKAGMPVGSPAAFASVQTGEME